MKITSKLIGRDVDFIGRYALIRGRVVKATNGVATIEHKVAGSWDTFNAYVSGDRIVRIYDLPPAPCSVLDAGPL